MTFRRAARRGARCAGGLHDSFKMPSIRIRTRIGFLVGFEVDVRRALLDRVEQDLVDEAHDRGVFDVVATDACPPRSSSPPVTSRLLEVHAVVLPPSAGICGVDLLDRLVDSHLQLVVFDDHGFDAEAGLEFDFVDGMQVGRIGDREEQPLAAVGEQGKHTVLLRAACP